MTREEAYNRIDAIIAKHEIDDVYVTITSFSDYDALRMARKALEQEPTTTVLQEIREEIRKDAEWWSEHDSLREQVLRDVLEDIIDKHIGDTE